MGAPPVGRSASGSGPHMINRRNALASGAAAGLTMAIGERALAQDERRPTSVDNPYVIANPTLGFVNLLGTAGADLLERDRTALAGVFQNNIVIADKKLPACNVLFLYCTLEASARVAGHNFSFRDLIKGAGAHVAVIASELPPDLLSNPDFGKALSGSRDWPANIVITLSRNGDHFGRFFQKLFSQMRAGVSMPMAWVRLAPQGPQQPKDIPGTICLMEAGHIAFGAKQG